MDLRGTADIENRTPGRRKARRFRLGWLVVALGVIVLSIVAVGTSLEQDRQLERIRQSAAEAEARLAEASDRNRDAHATLDSVGTDAYIERIARDKLGMVKPGEKLIVPVD